MRDQVASLIFDEVRFMKQNPIFKPYAHGEHEMGRGNHTTDMYKTEIYPSIYAHWSICPDCATIRTKKIIGYGLNEEGLHTAFVNEVIKGGKALQ